MRIGKMRHRVTLQGNRSFADALGQPVDQWYDLATIWADVLFSNGKETIASGKVTAETEASVRIRRRHVTTDMRLVFEGRIFDIKAVLPSVATVDLVVQEVT